MYNPLQCHCMYTSCNSDNDQYRPPPHRYISQCVLLISTTPSYAFWSLNTKPWRTFFFNLHYPQYCCTLVCNSALHNSHDWYPVSAYSFRLEANQWKAVPWFHSFIKLFDSISPGMRKLIIIHGMHKENIFFLSICYPDIPLYKVEKYVSEQKFIDAKRSIKMSIY